MAKKLSILDKTFQLALLLHRRTAEFNRKYKFTIGDRIDVVAEEAQEMILRANHQTDPKRAAQIIYDFVLRIDTLSLKLRMAVALGLMSDDAKAQCDMLIAKIKDEARGWRNYFLRGEVVAADFRDRIVQQALFEECGTLDDNMFSCRVGKGNLAAIQALQQQIFHQSKGYTADCYVAKFDLQSFFMSIDKRRLYDELVALVAKRYEGWDKDTLLYLIRVVTLHNPQDNAVRKTPLCDWADLPRSKSLYNVDWFLGLAIGNLTSQSDANFYNAPAMRWMRSVGLAPVNYVDDFAFVVRDKASFLTSMPYIRNYFAAERGLTMHPRKFYLQHYSKGIKFLGAVIKYNRVYTNNQTVARCFGKIHYYNEACRHSSRRKARHVEKLATILNSYLGLMRHFDTFNIRKRIAAEVGTVWCDCIRSDDDITTATVVKHFRQREICKYNVRKQRRRDLFTLKNLLNDGNTAAN